MPVSNLYVSFLHCVRTCVRNFCACICVRVYVMLRACVRTCTFVKYAYIRLSHSRRRDPTGGGEVRRVIASRTDWHVQSTGQ